MYIAVDFDATCVTDNYPDVGEDIGAAPVLRELAEKGHQLILWTMRSGADLALAVSWFKKKPHPPLWHQRKPGPARLDHQPQGLCAYPHRRRGAGRAAGASAARRRVRRLAKGAGGTRAARRAVRACCYNQIASMVIALPSPQPSPARAGEGARGDAAETGITCAYTRRYAKRMRGSFPSRDHSPNSLARWRRERVGVRVGPTHQRDPTFDGSSPITIYLKTGYRQLDFRLLHRP